MTSLPAGWATATIVDLGGTIGGKTPSKANDDYWLDGTVPWVSPKDMKVFEICGSEDRITEGAVANAGMHLLPIGSVLLVTRSGILAHTLPVAVTKVAVTINQDIKAIRPANSALSSRYLAYGLRALESRILNECTKSGTTVASVELPLLERLKIPFAPRAEQQRIADKLDTVLARVDACRDRLARVAPLLKRFRQSVLAAATSGRLTEDWRGKNAGPWSTTTVESLCSSISDGPFGSHLKSDDYVAAGARVVRLENIGHLTFDASKETYISMAKYASLDRHALIAGDLLFSSFVDEEVRVCRFPGELGSPAINKADCFCLRVNQDVCDSTFMMYRLGCKTTYMSLKEEVHGATRPRINLGQLRRFVLLLPAKAEQTEIVRRVETLFAYADRLEARLAQAHTAVDRLTPSLLAKAFRGELVPQDPADEAAADLLKRLAASRTAPAAKTRKPRQGQHA